MWRRSDGGLVKKCQNTSEVRAKAASFLPNEGCRVRSEPRLLVFYQTRGAEAGNNWA